MKEEISMVWKLHPILLKVGIEFIEPSICNFVTCLSIFLVIKPTCWMDDEGNLHGLFKDALVVAAKSLNLSLRFQETLPKNVNKWFIK